MDDADAVAPRGRRSGRTTLFVISAVVLGVITAGAALVALNAADGAPVTAVETSPGVVDGAFDTDAVLVLDVYSGRPNPQWEMSRGEFQRLTDATAQLPRAPEGAFREPGLGFRGIEVRFTAAGHSEPTIMSLDGTRVVVERPGEASVVFADTDGAVMRLASTAIASQTDDQVYRQLLQRWL